MPNTTSAKKRLRQNVVRRARNRAVRSALKTAVRKVRDSAAGGQASDADFREAVKKLDQAAARGVIHRNAAARVKSRLSAALKQARQTPAG